MLPTVLFLSLTTSVVYTTIVAKIPGPKKPAVDFSIINIGKLIANPQVDPTTIFKNKPVANTNFLPNLKSEYSKHSDYMGAFRILSKINDGVFLQK